MSSIARSRFVLFCAASLLVMSSCTPPKPVHKKAPAPTPTAVDSRGYMRNLSLAHASFELQPANPAAATRYVEKLNTLAPAQSSASAKQVNATAIILIYTLGRKRVEHSLLVPVSPLGEGNYALDSLRQVTTMLAPHKPQYLHVQARSIVISEPIAVPLKHTEPGEIRSKVDEAYDAIATTAQRLPPLEAAQLQLALSRFFMQQGIRDAAYVSLENSKQRLAEADTSTEDNAQTVAELSKQTTTLENQLHNKMPYQF